MVADTITKRKCESRCELKKIRNIICTILSKKIFVEEKTSTKKSKKEILILKIYDQFAFEIYVKSRK